jgi:endonuclease/exonuclease/phosphatase (EEP) superfamily protein YafD
LVLLVLARWVAWDSRSSLVAFNALTPIALLPAWPTLGVAALLRRRALTAVATALVVAHVVLVWPEATAGHPVPSAARTAPSLRVFDANVLSGNPDASGFGAEINAAHPDVVVLEESSPAFVEALDRTVPGRYPYRFTVDRTDPFAFALLSRLPLTDSSVVMVGGRPLAVRSTIQAPTGPQRLVAVHTVSPTGGHRQEWAAGLSEIRRLAALETGNLLVVGDFNATWGNRGFRALIDDGFSDAAAARGHPFSMTWPRNRPLVPPLVRIDHVLTRGVLSVTSIRTGAGHGSDHRPLIADVAL